MNDKNRGDDMVHNLSFTTHNSFVPQLRFPEFREAGEWQKAYLLTLFESLDAGVSVNSGDRPATSDEKGILKTSAITDGAFYPIENKIVSDASELERLRERVVEDTIIISRMNTPALVGANAYIERDHEDLFLPDRLWAAKPKPGTSMRFVAYILGSGKGRAALSALATGTSGSMKNIAKAAVLGLQILTPKPDEQQKIADCLSSLDTLIAAQADKLDALKTHKKGLMQQLFPREGETVPRLRFPEFREAGEWEIKKAKFLFSNRVEHGEDGLPVYSVTMNVGLAKRDSLARKIDDISFSSGNKKVYKHDIAYNMMRMWQGASGVAVEDCMVSPAYVILEPSDGVCAELYGYFLKLPQSLQALTAHSQGLTKDRLRLYYKDFAQIPLPKPPLGEQQKIAACLSSLDTLIAAQTDKLDALKTHKKGLLQQLFPSPEAMAA